MSNRTYNSQKWYISRRLHLSCLVFYSSSPVLPIWPQRRLYLENSSLYKCLDAFWNTIKGVCSQVGAQTWYNDIMWEQMIVGSCHVSAVTLSCYLCFMSAAGRNLDWLPRLSERLQHFGAPWLRLDEKQQRLQCEVETSPSRTIPVHKSLKERSEKIQTGRGGNALLLQP